MDVTVGTDLDRVVLYVRKLVIPLPYVQAIKIAANLILASNHCATYIHDKLLDHGTLVETDGEVPVISDERRGTMPVQFNWKIDVDGERVLLHMGGHVIKIHYVEAAKLGERMRTAGKEARAWAGDTRRQLVNVGHLTNAEDNYKAGIR